MRLRAELRVRNDAMISARRKRGWSQGTAAKAAGVSLRVIMQLEKLDYAHQDMEERAVAVAAALKIPIDQVLPVELLGRRMDTTYVAFAEVEPLRLVDAAMGRFILPAPDVALEKKEDIELAMKATREYLTDREYKILCKRFGLDGEEASTYREIAKDIGTIGKVRVRDLEWRAILKIREWLHWRHGDHPSVRTSSICRLCLSIQSRQHNPA